MIITVASGKGGTGKTTIATGLALSLAAEHTPPPLFLDCDVEAPNAHLFLKPEFCQEEAVELLIPRVDENRCTHCGKCVQVCQYHAITVLGKKTLVFSQLCHGCGSCTALCPEKAISEVPHAVGILQRGQASQEIAFARGLLDVGEPMAVPVIRKLLSWQKPLDGQVILRDSPPGTSCPVVVSMRGSDFILLVTEPTPFGLHDLRLADQVCRELGIPAGLIINRESRPYLEMEDYLRQEQLPVLMRFPMDRQIAAGVAQGKSIFDIYPGYRQEFLRLYQDIYHLSNAGERA